LFVGSEDLKLAADYSKLNFDELLNLDCISYKILVRDAFIYKLKQSEEGREYLEECWLLKQTSPDRNKLRNKFGSKAV
jgi:hypothetical protein